MKQKPLITVIVPFYNLEDCVNYCLESIKEQSYTNLEVLCIDDGSTDSTRRLIRAFTATDDRFRLIEQRNSGQAVARNRGVKEAKGEFVAFIDGDDYVSQDYIQRLFDACSNSDSCMAISAFADISLNTNGCQASFVDEKQSVSSANISVEELLYRDLVSSCWGRLAPKNVFLDHPLNLRFYEDVAVGAEYLAAVASIKFVDAPLYYHVRRMGSTVNAKYVSLQQVRDYAAAIEQQTVDLRSMKVDNRAIRYTRSLHLSRLYRIALRAESNDNYVEAVKVDCLNEIKGNLIGQLIDPNISWKNKARFVVAAIFPQHYDSLFNKFVDYQVNRS